MKKSEWEWFGFGFGAAIVLGVATWGALELAKKAIVAIKEKDLSHCCCCDDVDDDADEDADADKDIIEKSVNAHDEIVSPEFDRNTGETE